MDKTDELTRKYAMLGPHLDERTRRLWAASEAQAIGYGGISQVAKVVSLSRKSIRKGLREIQASAALPPRRIRRPGAGRKSAVAKQPGLLQALESLVEPLSRGDPESPLRWTCKSTRRLAGEMNRQGYSVSNCLVDTLLRQLEYRLQGNRKTTEGNQHPDRNAQFEHINVRVVDAMEDGQPVISVDTKKKELIGAYANKGRKWQGKGRRETVNAHDFPDPEVPRAYPYGVYDLARNHGFVNIGTDHDTSAFAVNSIYAWWRAAGRRSYPRARRLLITADGGGSNGSKRRLWKYELQRLSDRLGIPVSVCHFPPGTSKWNKVEHRLFSYISANWRGEPLTSYETVVNLISRTQTTAGLKVRCRLDRRRYPVGKVISDEEMAKLNLTRDCFHGEWNYTISPHGK
jgi:hypothetical protein